MNALRALVNQEDKCDRAIVAALEKGPKRMRIASREELKIEINKYKSVSLRLMAEMKKAGLKNPGYASTTQLEEKENGLRKKDENDELGLGGAQDHLEA